MYETLLGILGTGVLGLVGWVVQLGNRVSINESKREDLLVLITSKFDEVNRRLDRIERNQNGKSKE